MLVVATGAHPHERFYLAWDVLRDMRALHAGAELLAVLFALNEVRRFKRATA